MKKFYFFETKKHQVLPMKIFRPLPHQDIDGKKLVPYEVMIPTNLINDYPEGTIFCSSVEPPTEISVMTVTGDTSVQLKTDINMKDDFDFVNSLLPVSEDENFKFHNPEDRNEEYLAAYALFLAGNIHTENEAPVEENKKNIFSRETRPCDTSGKALPLKSIKFQTDEVKKVDKEWSIILDWTNKIRKESNNKTYKTSLSLNGTISCLHAAGESLRTIINRRRWYKIVSKISTDATPTKIPVKYYLATIYKEHENLSESSWEPEMETPTYEEVKDFTEIMVNAHKELHPKSDFNPEELTGMVEKALANGYTLDELLDSKRLKEPDLKEILTSLSEEGSNPEKNTPGMTKIEKLMSDPLNSCPTDEEGFHVDQATWKILIRNINDKNHTNTLLIGPTGTGKTEIVKRICEKTGRKLTIIQMGTITDPTEQLVGKMDLKNGETVYDWADFAKAIQTPGVILLDEVNRIPDNGDNILFSCLDDTRELSAAGAKEGETRTVKVHPDCVFIATANIGDAYTATKQMDEALFNRFMPVELDYLPIPVETEILMTRTGINTDDARNISIVAERTRSMTKTGDLSRSISTRETIRCANLISDGFSCLEAMEACFLPLYSNDGDIDGTSERSQMKIIISQRLNLKTTI